ncbi:MAG: deoxyribose-phosphate aldolase [Sphingobacteriales bacterium 50-39]|nr:MAG: deoxyribose-phosphate aldolase [Sphingobacteriales bacterium 50-39]
MNIASYIDHTILKPTSTHMEIKKICEEAVQYGFAAVCIPPSLVTFARTQAPRIATVIGFPFGYSVRKAKMAEAEQALLDGADELDMVINLVALRAGDWVYIEKELQQLTGLIHSHKKIIKVIIESGILTDQEILHCCDIAARVGVDFVKTSTGYAEKGASIEAVRLMRQHLPDSIKIKASGGIRTYEFARQLIEAGADRLGCSASVDIIKGQPTTTKEY